MENYTTGGDSEASDDEGDRWGSGRLVTIWKTKAAESEEMKCCGGSWSIQKGLSYMNGDDDEHDQGGLKKVDRCSTKTEENEVMLLNITTKGETGVG